MGTLCKCRLAAVLTATAISVTSFPGSALAEPSSGSGSGSGGPSGPRHRETDVGEPGVPAWGRAINDRGIVAGAQLGAGKVFVWNPRTGRTTVFDGQSDEPFTWDEPNAINSRGDVVGYSTASDGTTLATLWHT
jgi:hypothetical protein